MIRFIIFGPPGSGKGTYASRLQAKLGVDVIATGDLLREIMKEDTPLGRKVKGFVEKGLLGPSEVVTEVLKQRLAKSKGKKGFILDGYPRTIEQAKALGKLTKIDAIILLTVPEKIIIERLSSRRICKNCGEVYNIRFLKPKVEGVCDKCGGQLYQRSDDKPEVIKDRIAVYEKQTEPVLKYYKNKKTPFVEFKCDSLDMPPESAVEEILKQLKNSKLA
ncbi:MAG TPA: nucleoside monophosphate kinase [candidate division Zixibacteria bacterium]|nr:nucleoside monophosphate kinase [candidate division Zixibacteria bacterium]